jgi:carboxylate-amine ligase
MQRARPGLEAAGDLGVAERLLTLMRTRGTGVERQRRWFDARGSLADVVDELARVTWEA